MEVVPQQVEYIIDQGEGLRIEFKEATNSVPNDMYETVVSFSNTDFCKFANSPVAKVAKTYS